jgi:hypothetical protein
VISDLIALFSPVEARPQEVASRLVRYVEDELRGHLDPCYYACVELDSDRGRYRFHKETLTLGDEAELLRRIDRDGGSMWSMMLSLGFAPAQVYVAVFPDIREPSKVTVVLKIDSKITRWLEIEESTRVPLVVFLARTASVIGADCFVAGPNVVNWNPLKLDRDFPFDDLGSPYAVGWKSQVAEHSALIRSLKIRPDTIADTTAGYRINPRFPALP